MDFFHCEQGLFSFLSLEFTVEHMKYCWLSAIERKMLTEKKRPMENFFEDKKIMENKGERIFSWWPDDLISHSVGIFK